MRRHRLERDTQASRRRAARCIRDSADIQQQQRVVVAYDMNITLLRFYAPPAWRATLRVFAEACLITMLLLMLLRYAPYATPRWRDFLSPSPRRALDAILRRQPPDDIKTAIFF